MNVEEIKKQKEELLPEIRNLMSRYSQIIEKNEEEINEAEYEELKRMIDKYEKLRHKIYDLKSERIQKEETIQKVKKGKEIAPLVPIEDIVEGMTEEKLTELEKEYDELRNLFETEEYREFSQPELENKIKNYILKYEEKVKNEKDDKLKEEKIKEVKDLILSPKTEKGIWVTVRDPEWNGSGNVWRESIKKATSEKVAILYEKYGIKPAFFEEKSCYAEYETKYEIREGRAYSNIRFNPYEKCDLREKQACKEFEQRIGKLKSNENEEFDRPGIISLDLSFWAKSDESKMFLKENVQMEITQRELLNAGILPEDLGWKSLEQIKTEQKKEEMKVSSKSMIETEKNLEKGLTTREVSGIKGFFSKILDIFKGKGEK